MTTSMDIETRTASLDLLAVTIQALHVNGKQMTLAVFRQLPVADAYNDDGSLAPLEYWGLVRYAIKDEGDLWVVCACGGRLYRCPAYWYGDTVYKAMIERGRAIKKLQWWREVRIARETDKYAYIAPPHNAGPWTEDGLPYFEELVRESEEHLATCKRAESTRETLLNLPQLFIAV